MDSLVACSGLVGSVLTRLAGLLSYKKTDQLC